MRKIFTSRNKQTRLVKHTRIPKRVPSFQRGGIRKMSTPKGLLSGIRVLDFTRILAGPYCTMQLGDLGAEIIKIESLEGDDTRRWGPPFTKNGHESAYFLSLNRNKKSIAINLKTTKGQQLVYDLVKKCDIAVENWVPGRAEKLKIDYESLKRHQPSLVYAAISGYGQTGPYAHHLAYDVIVSGYGGLLSITGSVGGEPAKTGVALTDVCAGLSAFGSIMSAMYYREKTGLGQKLEISLLETQVAALANVGSNYLIGGIQPKMWGTAHESIVPYQHFSTTTQKIVVGALNDTQFQRLCHILQRPDLAEDTRFKTNPDRVKNRHVLIPILDSIFSSNSCDHWVHLLNHAEVPVAPINTLEKVFSDPQVLHCKMVQEVQHPTAGPIRLVGPPVKFSDPQPGVQTPPPLLGEHTHQILKNYLNYNESQIKSLIKEGIIQ